MWSKFLKDCLTGLDNETYDVARILWACGVIVYLGLAISDVCVTHRFPYAEFGTGFGIVLGSGGFAVWLKRDTEPKK